MSSASRRRDRERLEQDLLSAPYEQLLRDLQDTDPFLKQFDIWLDVLDFMQTGPPGDPRKDQVLGAILSAHADDGSPKWRTALLAMFWPGLESIHWRKRHCDRDPDERWQNVIWAFLQSVCRLDLRARSWRLMRKLLNDTSRRLYDNYARRWRQTDREVLSMPEELEALAGSHECCGLMEIELRDTQEHQARRLRSHVKAGRISHIDFLLILGTRLYGRSLAECAAEAGLSYEAAKKRRQRAEAAIRRLEKESGK